MKKIAIVSCYFQHNYGSMLQAYATQMVLDKLGYDNETIDISGFNKEIKKAKAIYFLKASISSDILLLKMGMAKNYLIKRFLQNEYVVLSKSRDIKFDEFAKKNFRLSKHYKSKEELSAQCSKKYSAVLVGSDQLWLPGNIAADYYTLNFVPDGINTIAYATSFGQSELPKTAMKKSAVFLKKIKHISVREESGQNLVKMIAKRNVPVVCDPTILFTGEEWMSIQGRRRIIDEPYIFCYFLGNNPLHREFAQRLRKFTGYKIVALIHLDEFVESDEEYADVKPYDIDPVDFINLICNAQYICTDSFHCSVFSMLFSRIFFAFRRYSSKTKMSTNSRLDTLFQLAGIPDRIFYGDEDIKSCLNMKIDYNKVHLCLKKLRVKSYQYLTAALEDEGSTDL